MTKLKSQRVVEFTADELGSLRAAFTSAGCPSGADIVISWFQENAPAARRLFTGVDETELEAALREVVETQEAADEAATVATDAVKASETAADVAEAAAYRADMLNEGSPDNIEPMDEVKAREAEANDGDLDNDGLDDDDELPEDIGPTVERPWRY